MKKLYVGNFPYNTTETDLSNLFSGYGELLNINLIKEKETGRSKGFGFVEFADQAHAQAALALDGHDLNGRPLKVSLAREQRAGGSGAPRGGRSTGRSNGGYRSSRS